MTTHETDVAIIGAGLSGLTTARLLTQAGVNFLMFEASKHIGGRIQSIRDPSDESVLADLGPTWVWPQLQPLVAKTAQTLELEFHEQYQEGLGIYEASNGEPAQHLPFPGQHGIARIVGGPQAIVDAIVEQITADTIKTDFPITQIKRQNGKYVLKRGNNPEDNIVAKRVVIACPLRIASKIAGLNELLPKEISELVEQTPTWMATHAKVSVVYSSPFWRDKGLSGRVASRIGPLVEMHDISGKTGTPAALFGFCGIPADRRRIETLEPAVMQQLVRCFGEEAKMPAAFKIMDWAREPYICSEADRRGALSHPQRLPDAIRAGFQDNTLFLGVSETANADPGLIAGALESGERVADGLIK